MKKSPEHRAKLAAVLQKHCANRKGKKNPWAKENVRKAIAARVSKFKHQLVDIDPVGLTATCKECGRVPLKTTKHNSQHRQGTQYLCWVGSLRFNNAKVAHSGQALEMFEEQKGLCALCREPMTEGFAQYGITLDHDHKTGLIRGFIHQRCNKALGHFNDAPELFRLAAQYLKKHLCPTN